MSDAPLFLFFNLGQQTRKITHEKLYQTKEEENAHRTGTSSRNATIISVFWVSLGECYK